MREDIRIREMLATDAAELSEILNEIITIGGTTAIEQTQSVQTINHYFYNGPDCLGCFVAVGASGRLYGFQGLSKSEKLAAGWAVIATFARVNGTQKGVGSALMPATLDFARTTGLSWIDATIRADNTGGLAYYDRMGFETYAIAPDVPLQSGLCVDRISKRRAVA